jgi:anaerobic ribonucleoside-triphosphate reductase
MLNAPQTTNKTITKIINKQKRKEIKMAMANCNVERTKCEVFSRSMGFIRPVSNFNIGKYSEFCERKTFTEANSLTAGQRHSDLMKMAA